MEKRSFGFTLVELAIVLVVIGLLVTGVFGGRELIKASERQEIIKEYRAFETAFKTFYLQYNSIPGDFQKASEYWSSASSGDGNGRIDYTGSFLTEGEEHYVWHHLSLSEVLSGSYDGVAGDLESIPYSKIGGYYRVSYQTDVYGISDNMISLNGLRDSMPNGPIFTLSDINIIELKMDDGYADKGKLLGFNEEGVPGCVTNDYTAGSGDYVASSGDNIICKAFFLLENL